MKKKMNLPNRLTLCRMVCVILIIVFFLIEFYSKNPLASFNISTGTYTWARVVILVLFVFGSITDFLDGHIARKHNLVTTFGKFLDPIADKLLVNVTAIFLGITGEIPFIVSVIYIFRDTIVDGIRLIAARKDVVIAASIFGKAKTVLQTVTLTVALALGPIAFATKWLHIVILVFAIASAVVSLASGIEYLCKNAKLISED